MKFLVVEVEEEELKALREALLILPLTQSFRDKLEEAIHEAESEDI